MFQHTGDEAPNNFPVIAYQFAEKCVTSHRGKVASREESKFMKQKCFYALYKCLFIQQYVDTTISRARTTQLSENNLGQFNAQKLSQTLYDDQLSKKFFEEYQKNCPTEDSGDDPAAIQRICQEMGIARSLAIMPLIMGNAREDHTGEMFLREASIFLPVGRVIILRLFKTHFFRHTNDKVKKIDRHK